MAIKTEAKKSTTARKLPATSGNAATEDDVTQNLRLLKAILNAPATSSTISKQPRRPKEPRSHALPQSAKPTKRVGTTSKDGKKPVVEVNQQQPYDPRPSIAEQKKLAMSCFNENFKILSAVARKQHINHLRASEVKGTEVAQISKDASQKSNWVAEESKDFITHAECACTALAVLRTCDPQESISDDSGYKREQGAIFLVDKMLSLELTDMAHMECSRIHEQCSRGCGGQTRSRSSKPYPAKIEISTMLPRSHETMDKKLVDLATSFQSQLLRLAILRGPVSVTKDFVHAVRVGTKGSPADMVISAYKNTFTTKQTAAQNLRTISQALLRIYTATVQSTQGLATGQDLLALDLLAEAQLTKLHSWELSNHEPDLGHELWPSVERGVKLLWAKNLMQHDQNRYDLTRTIIDGLQTELHTRSLHSELPTTLLQFLARLSESNEDYETAWKSLGKLYAASSGIKKLGISCQISAIALQGRLSEVCPNDYLTQIISVLTGAVDVDMTLGADDLVHVVRLRKACVERLYVLEHSDTVQPKIGPACLEVLMAILRFLLFSQRKRLDEKVEEAVRLSFLKTMEAVVDAERYAMSVRPPIFHAYLKNLEVCIEMISQLANLVIVHTQDEKHKSVLRALKVRISNAFWRAHIHPSITQTSENAEIKYAEISILCLDNIPLEELSKAALGPRLERLANMYIQRNDLESASSYFERAIKHYIATGALADVVEMSLSRRSGIAWTDESSLASQLGRALHSYDNTSIKTTSDFAARKLIYDDEALPPIYRAVLIEHQALYLLRKCSNVSMFQVLHDQVQKVVTFTDACQYYVWMLRFVSAFIFRAAKIPELTSQDISSLEHLTSAILHLKVETPDGFLQRYRLVLEIELKIQRALLTESPGQDNLAADLGLLLQTVQRCSKAEEFEAIIDDIDSLRSVIRAYIDQVFALHEYQSAAVCIQVLILLEERSLKSEKASLCKNYISLSSCQLRLDDIKSASLSLGQVKKLLEINECDAECTLKYQLASAELNLATSDLGGFESSLKAASSAFGTLWPKGKTMSSTEKIERDSFVAQAALLVSVFAYRRGDHLYANQYARQAAKISISIWSAVERRISCAGSLTKEDDTLHRLTKDLSKMDISSNRDIATSRAVGPKCWPYLNMHIRSIKHMAQILSHSGLFEDALHYFDQLKTLRVSMISARPFLNPTPALSVLLAKAGRTKEATQMISSSLPNFTGDCNQYGIEDAILSCCEASLVLGDFTHIKSLLSKLPALTCQGSAQNAETNVEKEVAKPISKPRRRAAKGENISMPPKRANSTTKAKASGHKCTLEPRVAERLSFNQLSNESRRKAVMSAYQGSLECSPPGIQDIPVSAHRFEPSNSLNQELYLEARNVLSQAWAELSADAFASVLTESAVALPSMTSASNRKSRVSFLQSRGGNIDSSPSKRLMPVQSTTNSGLRSVAHKLQYGLEICEFLLKDRLSHCPTDMIHSLFKMEARISLLLTSMNLPFVMSSTDLVLKVSQPKDQALERERIVSLSEQATQDRSTLCLWPTKFSSTNTLGIGVTKQQLNNLPASWSVVSLTLTEDNGELLLSKIIAGRDPFVVRIPLRRSNEGDGIDEFSFEDARSSMKEIIEAANSSCHDTRGTSDKATRAQWHGDRERLDGRLESLLGDIERIWLGGFRGALSPQAFGAEKIRQFGRLLTQSLNKNLPSRQKGSMEDGRVEVHEHILELFLGLGNPDEDDLDDSVMDLLYFVVDILQFSGECNAYDEIDWDAILVDVYDALRVCSECGPRAPPRHTILVLDKELELFPWEAMPCLIDQPVSRMPSLGSIFDRLSQIRTQPGGHDAMAYSVARSSAAGTYVVNPSGDLSSTQSLFEPVLADNLSPTRYTSLVHKAPSESQMSSLLRQSDIFLYIGHGSGAQYIRPRTIRALPSCAITFLFGCSSAKMTEHGAFESTGMPRAYMLGHAPAVVGCLWDVTDREIDRVALQTLVSWGLLDGDDERVRDALVRKRNRKGREKDKEAVWHKNKNKNDAKDGDDERRRTLVEAVKDGREACVLRYLCGAAVVVYGIPVILE